MNDDREWVEHLAELERMVTSFYTSLFIDEGISAPFCLTNALPRLSEDEFSTLDAPIRNEEIHYAIKHMGGFKAPGPDGLQVVFFKSHWDIVGNVVFQLIHDIKVEPLKVDDINETSIVMISKVDNVSYLKHMRPIGLCNVSYKILTKVLAPRFSQVMTSPP
uniref:Retrovirus-related Pol polyprotein LINE-1 n=1 Tax=Cajanus cajan TaxID=3821 RepID=A0A151SB40_CAJCA|nr:Retrovirus-related Pol polyprotein LINE-1 [Cajanus cajan]